MTSDERREETRRRFDPARPVLAFLRILVGGLFLLGLLLTFANVVGRYAFSVPINWAEEVTIFLMIGFVFIGIVQVSSERAQLRMDVVLDLLPPRVQHRVNLFTIVVELVASAVVVYASFKVAFTLGQLGRQSVAAQIPMAIPHSAVFIGFGLALLAVLWRLRTLIRMPTQGAIAEKPRASTAGSPAAKPEGEEKR